MGDTLAIAVESTGLPSHGEVGDSDTNSGNDSVEVKLWPRSERRSDGGESAGGTPLMGADYRRGVSGT